MFDMQRSATRNATELQDFLKDLNDWEGDIKKKDDQLKSSTKKEDGKSLPPVRGSQQQSTEKKKKDGRKGKENSMGNDSTRGNADKEISPSSGAKSATSAAKCASHSASTAAKSSDNPKKPSVPRDYRAWDKINVDEMLADLEIKEEVEKVLTPSASSSSSSDSEEEEEEEEMSLMKRKQKAAFEKERGNEFFKKGDYDKAIECYTTGIANDASNAVLLANRAMALLKQEKYGAAEADCDAALELDISYVKALMRRGTARMALKKLEEAKTDFDDVLFLEPNNKQAHQELIKVKKLIDRRGFESKSDAMERRRRKVAVEKQTELAGEGKSVRFNESEKRNGSKDGTSPSTSSSSSSSLKSSSDRVNSRWVIPISKPDEAVSKKPMRRIKIEEVGLSKEEMEAKRSLEDKSKNRLNQMSENDLKFFKGVGEGEEEMSIDLVPDSSANKLNEGKSKIEVLGKKKKTERTPTPSLDVEMKKSSKIQVIQETTRKKEKAAKTENVFNHRSDDDDNLLQRSRLAKAKGSDSDNFWQSVARDLDPNRPSTTSSSAEKSSEIVELKDVKNETKAADNSRLNRKSDGAKSPEQLYLKTSASHEQSAFVKSGTSSVVSSITSPSGDPSLPPPPTTALQLQNDLKLLSKAPSDLALNYLLSVPSTSLPSLIKNMLDTDLLMSIVGTFHRALVIDKRSPVDVTAHLLALSKTNRYDMAVMFLSAKDKKVIGELIEECVKDQKDAVRKKFPF